jgi:hypothetical protein
MQVTENTIQQDRMLIARIAVGREGPLQKVGDDWPAGILVGFFHLYQKLNIQGCVFAHEGCSRRFVAHDQWDVGHAVGVPLFDQLGDLSATEAAGVLEIAQLHTTVMFVAPKMNKAFDLFNRAKLGLVQVDHHFWMINPLANSPQNTASGLFSLGNTDLHSGSYFIGQAR